MQIRPTEARSAHGRKRSHHHLGVLAFNDFGNGLRNPRELPVAADQRHALQILRALEGNDGVRHY
jgi:hypothetical protein